jgi:hypothetical protein
MVDASGLDKEDVIMDARRFDTVTKAMAHDTTRRRVLRGLVAGICGGALIGLTGRQASAGKCCAQKHRDARAECRNFGKGCTPSNFECTENGNGTCDEAYGCFC